jgi:hypothetical protein
MKGAAHRGERYRYVEELLLAYRPVLDEIAQRLLEKKCWRRPSCGRCWQRAT